MTAPDTPLPPKPAFLDSLIRFLVWSSVVGTLAVPVLLILFFSGQIVLSFPPFRYDSGFGAVVNTLMAPSPTSGIATANGGRRAAQYHRLRSYTALPEMTLGAATRMNIVALTFDDKPEPAAPSPKPREVDPDGYRRMTLDLAQLPKEAVVVIADQPIRWTVAGARSAWGLIGFEGLAPFDIIDGRPGMLAGFRIAAFGAKNIARAINPAQADPAARRALCSALRLWADHFGLGTGQVAFALVRNASQLGSRDGAITSDGALATAWTGRAVEGACQR